MPSEPLICLQGPTSSGKTSLVAYLAAQTGHTFVRINNHEQTDLQVRLDQSAACMSETLCSMLACCWYGHLRHPLDLIEACPVSGNGVAATCPGKCRAHRCAEALACCC